MALHLPRSVSVNNLVGGYNDNATYVSLNDIQTNRALNVEVSRKGTIKKRYGYRPIAHTDAVDDLCRGGGWANTNAVSTIRQRAPAMVGYAHYISSDDDPESWHVMHSFDGSINIWPVGSPVDVNPLASANNTLPIDRGSSKTIVDKYNHMYTMIQDPRDATREMMVWTDFKFNRTIQTWSPRFGVSQTSFGIYEPVNLSAVAGASNVPNGKFIATFQNRLVIANINDSTDADSNVKIQWSDIDTNGVPQPHQFDPLNFVYVGGSDKYGAITGMAVLHDQLIVFKRNAIFKVNVFGTGKNVDVSVVQMNENIGCVAPGTITVAENVVFFLSELGVYAFNGNVVTYLGYAVENEIRSANKLRIDGAVGAYERGSNRYYLSFPGPGAYNNNRMLVFDIDRQIWYPPWNSINAVCMGTFQNEQGAARLAFGDKTARLQEFHEQYVDGTTVSGARFRLAKIFKADEIGLCGGVGVTDGFGVPNVGAALKYLSGGTGAFNVLKTNANIHVGQYAEIVSGCGLGQRGLIKAQGLFHLLTFDEFPLGGDSSTIIKIGGYNSYWQSKDYDFGAADTDKIFRRITVRTDQKGNYNMALNYIVDFNTIGDAASANVLLHDDGLIWETSLATSLTVWGGAAWNGKANLIREVDLRSIPTQPLTGKYLALRFSSDGYHDGWEVYGFDIQVKEIGRR